MLCPPSSSPYSHGNINLHAPHSSTSFHVTPPLPPPPLPPPRRRGPDLQLQLNLRRRARCRPAPRALRRRPQLRGPLRAALRACQSCCCCRALWLPLPLPRALSLSHGICRLWGRECEGVRPGWLAVGLLGPTHAATLLAHREWSEVAWKCDELLEVVLWCLKLVLVRVKTTHAGTLPVRWERLVVNRRMTRPQAGITGEK